MTIYTPLEPPPVTQSHTPSKLTEAQEEKRKQLIAHYSDAEYKVGEDSEKGELTEDERFWLVSETTR